MKIPRPENFFSLESRFETLKENWMRSDEKFHTDPLTHVSYQEIIKFGEVMIPYIIEEFFRNHENWIPALEEITRIQTPNPDQISNDVIDFWVNWAKNRNYI